MRNHSLPAHVARLCAITPLLAAGLLAATAFPEPPKVSAEPQAQKQETAVLAGGCFWGMQGIFEHVKGVISTEVGYAGGTKKDADYETVSTGRTRHAESLKVVYDPAQISYGTLLKIYFSVAHDPTTLNRQHYDVGPQYRSSIFYANDEQKKLAEEYVKQLDAARVYRDPIVTKIVPLQGFYRAEDYHQHYLDHNPNQPYIANVDIPLLENFKKTYPDLYTPKSR
jgi:peptide-methionine (S)-S-oxide reductase